jgi:hypothetical protein
MQLASWISPEHPLAQIQSIQDYDTSQNLNKAPDTLIFHAQWQHKHIERNCCFHSRISSLQFYGSGVFHVINIAAGVRIRSATSGETHPMALPI